MLLASNLGIWLSPRHRIAKCFHFIAAVGDRNQLGEFGYRKAKSFRRTQLRDEAHIGKCWMVAKTVSRGAVGQLFTGFKASLDPVSAPLIALILVYTKVLGKVTEDTQIVQRMDVAGDRECKGPYSGLLEGVRGQQLRTRMHLIDIFNDRQRLGQNAGIGFEGRYEPLGIDRAIDFGLLLSPPAAQVNKMRVVRLKTLEVECDPAPPSSR